MLEVGSLIIQVMHVQVCVLRDTFVELLGLFWPFVIHTLVQAGLNLNAILPQPSEYRDEVHDPPRAAAYFVNFASKAPAGRRSS